MNLNQLNILLADDDQDDRYFFERALNEIQIPTKLTTVSDGVKLMNYLSENSENLPDVLFLDINMPRKNGFDCLSEIKHNEKLQDLQVVMFSTTNSPDTITMLFKGGARVYVHKPSDFKQLKEVINHALLIASEKIFSTGQIKYILNA
jgi:CheY-like chemotaxis protein